MKIDPNANMEDVSIRFFAALELMKGMTSNNDCNWTSNDAHQPLAELALHAADQLIAAYNRDEQ